MKNIILCGIKNIGKTSIGKELAYFLKKEFIDTDEILIIKYNNIFNTSLTIREIAIKHGESWFRNFESYIIKNLNLYNSIVSLGGGTDLNILNGTYVCLTTNLFIKNNYINFAFYNSKILKRLKKRDILCKNKADFIINIDNLSKKEIINNILKNIYG